MTNSISIFAYLRQLWYKFRWNTKEKYVAEQTMRTHLKSMLKGGTMQRLGGKLRLSQQIGKMKHEHKTKMTVVK